MYVLILSVGAADGGLFYVIALGQKNDNFVCCPDEALEWRSRRYHILEEIVEYCPDIMCLQVGTELV
jgi:hypothetical protein